LSFFFLNGDETGGRMTSLLAVTWKFPFDEEAFLADLDLDFFFLLGLGFCEKEILSTPSFLSREKLTRQKKTEQFGKTSVFE
jgi:hypothetical protein